MKKRIEVETDERDIPHPEANTREDQESAADRSATDTAPNADITVPLPSPETEADAGEPQESTIPASRFLRLQADFENFRKRTLREKSEWYQRANENLLEELLPVLDHFEIGLQKAREHHADQSVVDGFNLVYEQLMAVLTKCGLSEVNARGDLFDPHQHEAITYMPSNDVPAETVMEQTRKGYKLGEKLIRPAQVVVSSGNPEMTIQPGESV
jgi:molecular chaperone GrpE